MMTVKRAFGVWAVLLAGGLAGCGGGDDAPEPSDSNNDGEHVHAAPHGGVLVELGDHAANLEVVFDAQEGLIQLYLLNAHAEGPIRIAAESITAELLLEGNSTKRILFSAVASSLTGEIVGDTSAFEYRDTTPDMDIVEQIVISELELRSMRFENIVVTIQLDDGKERLRAIANEN